MKKIPQAQGARPRVVCAIIVIPLLVIGLLASFGHKKPLKLTDSEQAETIAAELTETPSGHPRELAYVQPTEPADDVAPETEAALAQFGLSAKHGIKLSVTARALPPVILPKTQ